MATRALTRAPSRGFTRPLSWGSGGAEYSEQGVVFDGVNDYLQRAAALVGAAETASFIYFASFKMTNTAIGLENINVTDGNVIRTRRQSNGSVDIRFEDSASNVLMAGNLGVAAAGQRFNLLCTHEPSVGTERVYYWSGTSWIVDIDRASGSELLDIPGATTFSIGASISGANKAAVTIYRIALWQNPTTVPDISQSSVQNKFSDSSTGALVDPATSVADYGTPIVDLYGDAAAWNAGTNKGSGGDFVMNGSVVNE